MSAPPRFRLTESPAPPRGPGQGSHVASRRAPLSLLPVLSVVVCLLYAALLQWSYLTVEGVAGYSATNVKDIALPYLLASFAAIGVIAAMLPVQLQRPSHMALWILYLTFYLPSMLFAFHVGELEEAETMTFLIVFSVSFAVLILVCARSPIQLPAVKVNHTTFVLALTFVTAAIIGGVLWVVPQTHSGSLQDLFVLDDVYIRRLQSRTVVTGRSFTGYAFATMASSLAPIALLYGLTTHRRRFAVLGTLGLLAIFMMDGTKGNLFAPALFVGLLAMARRRSLPFGLVSALVLTSIVGASIYAYTVHDSLWLSANIVRRVLVARATTLGAYFEMFRGAPVYMKDSSVMALLGERATDKADVIGLAYANDIDAHWNGNAWAAMFGDFGLPGLFIASVVAGVILLCYDGAAKRAPFPIVAVMAGYLAHTWGDAAVTSSILTYGVLSTLFVLTHYGQHADTPSVGETGRRGPRSASRERAMPPLVAGRTPS